MGKPGHNADQCRPRARRHAGPRGGRTIAALIPPAPLPKQVGAACHLHKDGRIVPAPACFSPGRCLPPEGHA
ncbi:protein of unknown function [Rhodovastum atsumiense]|nr:protein of unknown function [Rhodovastum atsumiense]